MQLLDKFFLAESKWPETTGLLKSRFGPNLLLDCLKLLLGWQKLESQICHKSCRKGEVRPHSIYIKDIHPAVFARSLWGGWMKVDVC